MTLVNLLANMLVSSYTNITVLPMAKDKLPALNKAYVHETGRGFRILGINPSEVENNAQVPITSNDDVPEIKLATQGPESPCLWEIEGREEFLSQTKVRV
jgi:hypothetical protein